MNEVILKIKDGHKQNWFNYRSFIIFKAFFNYFNSNPWRITYKSYTKYNY